MKQILTAHEKRCINKLIELGLFTRVMPEKLGIGKGVIIVPCSDGHQFGDLYRHITDMCKQAADTELIHPVALNGGAMLMSGHLTAEDGVLDGDAIFRSIIKANKMNRGKDVIIYAHFPCGIARENCVGVVDQGLYLMMAKKRLKEAAPNLEIECLFHIDMYDEVEGGTHKRRTYFMPKELWNNAGILPILHDFRSML